jgi:ATP-dependent DNA helicase DinG
MPARECVGAAKCPFGADCFAEASRMRAREADVVVTNHSLLAVDMLADRHIIPPHKLLVVDEAHELADRVSSAAQAELSPDAVDRAARRARSAIDPESYDALTEAGDGLTVGLADVPAGRLTTGLPTALAGALTTLDAAARRALDGIGDVKSDDPDPVRKQQAKTVLGDLSKTAQRLLEFASHDVAWIEKDDRGRRAVVVAPLSVAGTLSRHLYEERTVVATSATLALGGRFDTVATSLGLDEETDWNALDVGSPFDYGRQGILYVAAHLPRPTMSGCRRPPPTRWWRWWRRCAAAPSGCSPAGGPPSGRRRCCANAPT